MANSKQDEQRFSKEQHQQLTELHQEKTDLYWLAQRNLELGTRESPQLIDESIQEKVKLVKRQAEGIREMDQLLSQQRS